MWTDEEVLNHEEQFNKYCVSSLVCKITRKWNKQNEKEFTLEGILTSFFSPTCCWCASATNGSRASGWEQVCHNITNDNCVAFTMKTELSLSALSQEIPCQWSLSHSMSATIQRVSKIAHPCWICSNEMSSPTLTVELEINECHWLNEQVSHIICYSAQFVFTSHISTAQQSSLISRYRIKSFVFVWVLLSSDHQRRRF